MIGKRTFKKKISNPKKKKKKAHKCMKVVRKTNINLIVKGEIILFNFF